MQHLKNSFFKFLPLLIIFTILISLPVTSFAQKTKGVITGKIVDSESGYPLIGANAFIKGTTLGSSSDLEGKYRVVAVDPGNHTLVVSYMGYQTKEITDIQVTAGQVTTLDISLSYEVLQGQEVVVTAKAMKNTEAALLKNRQKAVAVSDAISSEAISQAGAGNAAEAMKQVTGASVVGGKHIYVRGLGGRYTSTQLNGVEIPSTDPYKRGGSVDLIPTNLVDNIVTVKSFTPDKPGDFSGGTVDIKTKDFPEDLTLSFSAGTSFNPQVNLNDNGPILYDGSGSDWLGYDDGLRNAPISDNSIIPDLGSAGSDYQTAVELDRIVNLFNQTMTPTAYTPPLNQSYSISVGNQFNMADRPFGFLASLTYKKNYSSYDDGVYARWGLGSAQQNYLTNEYDLTDTQTQEDVLWGALLKTSYKISPNHIIRLDGMLNQNGVSSARYLSGRYPYDLGENDTYRTSELAYTERTLQSYQLSGEHVFNTLNKSKLQWHVSYGSTQQNEPDRRYFTSFKNSRGYYGIATNLPPLRYYRDMSETRQEFKLDYEIPFKQWEGKLGNIKVGALYAKKERDFEQTVYEYQQEPVFRYEGDDENFFSDSNLGLIDSTSLVIAGKTYKRYDFGLVVRNQFIDGNMYDGEEEISATYFMVDLPVSDNFRFIGGARYETTDLLVEHNAINRPTGDANTKDLLPAINFIYNLKEDMNMRASFGRTLARPNIREVAPYASFDFVGGTTYIGNPELERSIIDNYDIRWEWFVNPGEIFAATAFYKSFESPIEKVITNDRGDITWQNVPEATVMGIELEARKRLDIIHSSLTDFLLGGNLSLVKSEVDIAEEQLTIIREVRPDASSTREFQGQSPYLFNVNLSYENYEKGYSASVYYNIFGKRLSYVSLGGTPDVYEMPFAMLNFNASWKINNRLQFSGSISNILDSEAKHSQEFLDKEYIYEMHKLGRTFSIGLKYSL